MSLSANDLEKLAQLAYIEEDPNSTLAEDINSIMNFVEQLRKIDTSGVAPRFHPLEDHNQRLRLDEITEKDCSSELASIAPSFEKGCYLVPKVIDSGQ